MLPRVLAAFLGVLATMVTVAPTHAATPRTHLARWSDDAQFNTGTRNHVAASGGTLRLAGALPTTTWDDPYSSGGSVSSTGATPVSA